MNLELCKTLDYAEYIRYDKERNILWVYYGGPYIHQLSPSGLELTAIGVDGQSKEEVKERINSLIERRETNGKV